MARRYEETEEEKLHVTFEFLEPRYSPDRRTFTNHLQLADYLTEHYRQVMESFNTYIDENEPDKVTFRSKEYTTSEMLLEMGSIYWEEYNSWITDETEYIWEDLVINNEAGSEEWTAEFGDLVVRIYRGD